MAGIEVRPGMVSSPEEGAGSAPSRLETPVLEPVPVVRVFAVAPIPVEEFEENLKRGQTPFFSEVIISQKSNLSKPSPNNLTAVGGAIEPGESVVQAGLAEFAEEATGYTMTIDGLKQSWMESGQPRIKPYIYRIPGEEYKQGRKVYLVVAPFVSRSFATYKVREGGHGSADKMKQMIQLTPEDLRKLIENGSLELPIGEVKIEGHLTKMRSEIEISPPQARKRNKALNQVVEQVWRFEKQLRDETLRQINVIRTWKHRELASSLIGLDRREIIAGFVAAQMKLGLYDERLRELNSGNMPPPKKDLLKFIQYAIGVDSDQLTNLLFVRSTREVLHGANLLKRAMRRAVIELYPPERRAGLRTLVALSEIRRRLPPYVERPLRQMIKYFTGETRSGLESLNPYAMLGEILPQVQKMSLSQRVEAFQRANKRMVAEIARMRGIAKSDVYDAYETAVGEPAYIDQSMQREFIIQSLRNPQDPNHPIYFQDHQPIDTVSNAKLFTLAIEWLGLHPNTVTEPSDKRKVLQTQTLESGRNLAYFLANLDRITMVKYADNSLFEGAFDSIFRWPPDKEVIDLGDNVFHPVYHYRTKMQFGGRELHIIKDERSRKTLQRAGIKAFQDWDLTDVYSTNFVLADDNFPAAGPAQIEERLQLSEQFKEALLAHMQAEVERDGWRVSMMPEKYNDKPITNLRTVLAMPADRRQAYMTTLSGKRAASKSDAIIRYKFVLRAERDRKIKRWPRKPQFIKDVLTHEICIYPFEHMECEAVGELKDCGFWAFRETIRDDAVGDYPTTRLHARDRERPTDPTLYELSYPPPLYGLLATRIMGRQVQKRRFRRGG